MTAKTITQLTALAATGAASADVLPIVDVSDTTMAATGTTKKITLTDLQSAPVSAGTANGVLYLNGSKVATSGSALTFDGANLQLQAASGNSQAVIRGGTGGQALLAVNAGGDAQTFSVLTNPSSIFLDSSAGLTFRNTAGDYTYSIAGSEKMRLTSTGLGIGTSSPISDSKLTINETQGGATVKLSFATAGTERSAISMSGTSGEFRVSAGYAGYGGFSTFYTSGSERLRLDANGNLGLGVTPSAWGSGVKAIQTVGASLWSSNSGNSIFTQNGYNDGTDTKYVTSNYASQYQQATGGHYWYTAPSGTAGNAISFTQAMTLDASGNLGIGITNPAQKLEVNGLIRITNNDDAIFWSGGGTQIAGNDNGSAGYLRFNVAGPERARIDSSGNLLVGATSTGNSLNSGGVWIAPGIASSTLTGHSSSAQSGDAFASYWVNSIPVGAIIQNGTTGVSYNTTSDYRLKDNQAPLTGSGAFIDALKPKTWTWKTDGARGVGFIAHEVQEVSPTSVVGEKDATRIEQYEVSPAVPATYDEEGNELTPAVEAVMGEREVPAYQAMEYGSAEFIANIVAELQSLRKRVAALETK